MSRDIPSDSEQPPLAQTTFSVVRDDVISAMLSINRGLPLLKQYEVRTQAFAWIVLLLLLLPVALNGWATAHISSYRSTLAIKLALWVSMILLCLFALAWFWLLIRPAFRWPRGFLLTQQVMRQMREGRIPMAFGPTTASITQRSIIISNPLDRTERYWRGGVLRVTRDELSILFWIAPNRAFFVPTRAFESRAENDAFFNTAVRCWEAGGKGLDPHLATLLADRSAVCPACAYPLKGIQSPACPECGLWLTQSMFIDLDADKSAPVD